MERERSCRWLSAIICTPAALITTTQICCVSCRIACTRVGVIPRFRFAGFHRLKFNFASSYRNFWFQKKLNKQFYCRNTQKTLKTHTEKNERVEGNGNVSFKRMRRLRVAKQIFVQLKWFFFSVSTQNLSLRTVYIRKKGTLIIYGDMYQKNSGCLVHNCMYFNKNYSLRRKTSWKTGYLTEIHSIITQTSEIFLESPWIIRVPVFSCRQWKQSIPASRRKIMSLGRKMITGTQPKFFMHL